jgi:hypothetical protein
MSRADYHAAARRTSANASGILRRLPGTREGVFAGPILGYRRHRKMEPESVNTRPLGQRIRDLADDVSALRKAIHDELDWRQKNHSVDIEDWDDDQ